jgi:photosystem II stability/assembly factor-like uncharacterized protein
VLLVICLPAAPAVGETRAASASRSYVGLARGFSSGGPYGGRILSLAADPQDGRVLYAGTEIGLYRSEDGGVSWTVLPLGRNFLIPASNPFGNRIEAVVVNPADPSVLLATVATLDRVSNWPFWALFRSDDRGESWSWVLAAEQPLAAAFHGEMAYANTSPGGTAVESNDGGRTFRPLPLSYVVSIVALPGPPTTLLASVSLDLQTGGVHRSRDGGRSWEPTALTDIAAFSLHVDEARPLTVYAEGDGFYRSDDGGSHWTPNRWLLEAPIVAFAFGPGAHAYAATSAGEVYESANRGDTWSRVGEVTGGLLSLAVAERALLAGANGKGVLRSDDEGASWIARNGGLDAAPVGALAVAPSAGHIAYALAAGFARTTDAGESWFVDPAAPTAPAGGLAVDPLDAAVVYASDATAGVLRSDDGGSTWVPTSPTGRFVRSLTISPQTPSTVYMADGEPWKSTSGGESWSLVADGIPFGVNRIVADPAVPDLVYASNGDLYRSDDAGDGWVVLRSAEEFLGPVTAVAPDPAHPGTVYAVAYSYYLWRSTDRGVTWARVELPDSQGASAVAVDAYGAVWVGAYRPQIHGPNRPSAPLRSVDGGASWQAVARWGVREGPIGFVDVLAFGEEGARLFVGTSANGVWQVGFRATHTVPPR